MDLLSGYSSMRSVNGDPVSIREIGIEVRNPFEWVHSTHDGICLPSNDLVQPFSSTALRRGCIRTPSVSRRKPVRTKAATSNRDRDASVRSTPAQFQRFDAPPIPACRLKPFEECLRPANFQIRPPSTSTPSAMFRSGVTQDLHTVQGT